MQMPEDGQQQDKKKQSELTFKDITCSRLSVFGAILLLACLVPHTPWRMSMPDPFFAGRFSTGRHYSPFWATNHMRQGVPWMKLKRDTCTAVQGFMTPSPYAMLTTVAASMTEMGGAVGGCASWADCQTHATQRCYQYATLMIVGFVTMFLLVVSVIASSAVPMMMGFEASKKKQSKKEEAKTKTMFCTIAAFVSSFLGVFAWLGASQQAFTTLKTTGYYPWPGVFVGTYIAYAAIFCQLIAMLLGLMRMTPPKEEAQPEEEQYMDAGPGHPGPYGPPMGGPPMGGPPMGMMGGPPMPPHMMGGPMR
mmetsp:Transcript_96718/g.282754  ORF Transcript_96718/g.282754 Transcript_96718/m.282754 type:complete len:307 (-) Transcript_96718:34-954(-)